MPSVLATSARVLNASFGAAFIIAVLVIVIYAAVVLLEQLAVTADPSDATDDGSTFPSRPAPCWRRSRVYSSGLLRSRSGSLFVGRSTSTSRKVIRDGS